MDAAPSRGPEPGGPDPGAAEPQPDPSPEWRLREQLLAFARDINTLYQREQERSRQLESALRELKDSYLATAEALALMVEWNDRDTRQHLYRTRKYGLAIAARVTGGGFDAESFEYGFLLHDVGKVGIPQKILTKEGPLTEAEWEIMRTHPLLGAQFLSGIKFLERAVPIVEGHHERWDGTGYPHKRRGEEIPLGARIFFVADAFDAMTSDRPYRRALPIDQAIEEIDKGAGTQFDPEVVRALVDMWPDLRLLHEAHRDL